jgi:uncharacterized protein YneF (UPF0154 family)
MLTNLKALTVVLGIAMVVFILAKPICLRFMQEHDFARRRNVWIALTVSGFLSPSFWLYVLVALPLLAWAARKDSNPVALYLLLLHVIPPIGAQIPVVVINELFKLDNYRVLSLAVLIPWAWRLMQSRDSRTTGPELRLMDFLLIAYAVLHLVLLMPYETITHTMRRGFLFVIDVLVLYFVISRSCTSQRSIVEAMAAFCLACAIFAPLALFESLKTWVLYGGIGGQWSTPIPFAYLFRGDTLRAQVSAGHAIALGYMIAIAFGFWLYLRSRMRSTPTGFAVAVWLCTGLLAAYSRAPWIVAVVILFAYLGLGPNGSARFSKALVISVVLGGVILSTPIGERVIDNLPFIGTVDAVNITYRQRLAQLSWQLIQQNPFFGNPFVLLYLEELRTGQGIIDLMNTYATIGMYYGLVGLFLFLGPFVVGMWTARKLAKQSLKANPDFSLLGMNLIACMFGTLFMMATGSFGTGLAKLFYVLAGLAAAYTQLGSTQQTARVQRNVRLADFGGISPVPRRAP